MNENLKVNSKTDILEFKRKHNLLVENGTIKANVSNIKSLSNDVINNLRCGDIVLKEDSTGKHAYLVSFKSDTGLCLTYCDAYCVETQSYDKSGNNWVYNSEDKTIIAEPLMENIVDSQGNKRFIEGDINLLEDLPSGVVKDYGKWSLSGSHLMFVLALSLDNGLDIASRDYCVINLPKWIYDKINILFQTSVVDRNSFLAWDAGYGTQNLTATLNKKENGITIGISGFQLPADRHIRISFDLLIDNE